MPVRRRPLRPLVAGALVVALATAACSDSDDGGDAGPTTTAVETTTTVAEVVDPVADAARAEEIVLKQSDLPEGWTPVPEPEGSADEGKRLEDTFAQCLGVEPPAEQPSAESPEFVSGTLTQVSAGVELAPSAAVARQELARLEGRKALECVARQFDASQADSGLDFAPSRAQELDFPDLGDGTVAIRITTLLTNEGQQITIYADIVSMIKGRVELTVYFLKGFQPFPRDLADSLARRLVARA